MLEVTSLEENIAFINTAYSGKGTAVPDYTGSYRTNLAWKRLLMRKHFDDGNFMASVKKVFVDTLKLMFLRLLSTLLMLLKPIYI